jgi:hypothetical protein
VAKTTKSKKVHAAKTSIPSFGNITSPGAMGMVKVAKKGASIKGSTPKTRNPKRSALIPGK